MIYKTKNGQEIEIDPNSRPIFLKRIFSVIFDVGVVFALFFGVYLLTLKTPIANNYHNYYNEARTIEDNIMLETGYGYISYCEEGVSYKDYVVHTDDSGNKYVVKVVENPTDEVKKAFTTTLNSSDHFRDAKFSMNLHGYLCNVFAAAIVETVYFLVVPLVNHKRATPGQLLFKISLYCFGYEEYAHWYHVLFRFLFIFFIESLIPYIWLGMYTPIAVCVVNFIVVILSKKYRTLRDFVTRTMLIEDASYDPLVNEQ